MTKSIGFLIVDTQENFDSWHEQVKTSKGLPNSTTTGYASCRPNMDTEQTDFYFSIMDDLDAVDDPRSTSFTGIGQDLKSAQDLIDLGYIEDIS